MHKIREIILEIEYFFQDQKRTEATCWHRSQKQIDFTNKLFPNPRENVFGVQILYMKYFALANKSCSILWSCCCSILWGKVSVYIHGQFFSYGKYGLISIFKIIWKCMFDEVLYKGLRLVCLYKGLSRQVWVGGETSGKVSPHQSVGFSQIIRSSDLHLVFLRWFCNIPLSSTFSRAQQTGVSEQMPETLNKIKTFRKQEDSTVPAWLIWGKQLKAIIARLSTVHLVLVCV